MDDDIIGAWFRDRDKKTTFSTLFIIAFLFLSPVICFWGDGDNLEQKEVHAEVRVNYQIQYGSIYTGNQTPIIYKGTEILRVSENGLGANGLPIMGFFPTCTKLPFTLDNGNRLVLRIPVINRSMVISLAMTGKKRHVLFKTQIEKQNNCIFIKATPLTFEEWKQFYI